MRIEDYFQQIRDAIDASPITQSSTITYDKRPTYPGFIRGDVYFRNLKPPSFPHHKHEGSKINIVASRAPILTEVLNEIESLVQLP